MDKKGSSQQLHSKEIKDLQFSSEGKYLISLDKNNKAILWQIIQKRDKTPTLEKRKEEYNVNTIRISPKYRDGIVIAIAVKDRDKNKIKLWDIRGRDIAEYKTEMNKIEYLRFTPFRGDSNNANYENYIIASDEKGNIKAWEINNAQKLIQKSCKWLKAAYIWNDSFVNNCL